MEELRAQIKKDCRGIGCPMNLVHTKVALAKIAPGEVLELFLDDGPPVENVTKSVEKEGHTIIRRRAMDDGSWELLVQKGE